LRFEVLVAVFMIRMSSYVQQTATDHMRCLVAPNTGPSGR